jgi:hypothetical protein
LAWTQKKLRTKLKDEQEWKRDWEQRRTRRDGEYGRERPNVGYEGELGKYPGD